LFSEEEYQWVKFKKNQIEIIDKVLNLVVISVIIIVFSIFVGGYYESDIFLTG